jgi:hypothetical protein
MSLKNLPAAVRATVENETKNAKIKGVSKEKEKGKTVYELETMVGNRTRDLMIDEAGKVYVVEEQIDPASAPAPVRAALEKRGSILKLESVQENGTTTLRRTGEDVRWKKGHAGARWLGQSGEEMIGILRARMTACTTRLGT